MNFSIQSVYNWYRSLLRNPKYRWWVVLATMLYFVSPIDVVPDILPIVGELDDVFLLTLLVSEVSQLVIEGFKARKGNFNATDANTTEGSDTTASTVDVDAVSVK
jgi:uncharacterized membrane protein YkvA (DUF1232 family)